MSRAHFPDRIRSLPPFEGPFDAFRLAVPVLGYQFNAQFLAALPYLLTLLVMFFITKSFRQPAGLAQPFIRGLR